MPTYPINMLVRADCCVTVHHCESQAGTLNNPASMLLHQLPPSNNSRRLITQKCGELSFSCPFFFFFPAAVRLLNYCSRKQGSDTNLHSLVFLLPPPSDNSPLFSWIIALCKWTWLIELQKTLSQLQPTPIMMLYHSVSRRPGGTLLPAGGELSSDYSYLTEHRTPSMESHCNGEWNKENSFTCAYAAVRRARCGLLRLVFCCRSGMLQRIFAGLKAADHKYCHD